MKNAMKKGSILALVFALLVSPLAMSALYAAIGIETDRTDASIVFHTGEAYTELEGMEIPVKLYRIAEINEAGAYTAKEDFKELKLSDVNAKTTAEEWQEKTEKAVLAVEEKEVAPDKEIILNSLENAENKAEDLPVGLYLIQAETVQSPWYEYSFSPYLLSLPNNYYDPQNGTSSDEWIYHVETELKPDQTDRYGDLEIEKTLTSYNETLGPAFFVFQIEAVKEGKNVYSDVVSLNFNEPGVKTLLVSHIPAGAEVTVTEIYGGASYAAVSGKEQTTVIIAEDSEGSPVRVSFENEYDKRLNGGSGIVNHFKFDAGKWDCEQEMDSTGENKKPSGDGTDDKKQEQTPNENETKADVYEIESNEGGEETVRRQSASSTRMERTGAENRSEAVLTAAEAVQTASADTMQTQTQQQQEEGQENAEDSPEEEITKAEDENVPLADMVKDILSNENSRLITAVGTAALAGVMSVTFGFVWFRKRARINAKSRKIPMKRK